MASTSAEPALAAVEEPELREDVSAEVRVEDVDEYVEVDDVEVGRAAAVVVASPPSPVSWWSPWVHNVVSGLAKAATDLFAGGDMDDSTTPTVVTTEQCPICCDESPSFSPPCGHAFCQTCTVHYVRDALGDKSRVFPQGVRCPMHATGCDAFVNSSDALRLLSNRDAKARSGVKPQARSAFPALSGVAMQLPSAWSRHAAVC